MKKQFFKTIAIAVLLIATAVSCTEDTIRVKKVILTPTPLLLGVDVSAQLEVIILPLDAANKNVTWTSSNEAVATVSRGKVTAKAVGLALITVTTEDGNFQATCEVTVIEIPNIAMVMVEGGTFTMGCTDDTYGQYPDELPPHQVTVSSFQIGKYTITQKEWITFMGNRPNYGEEDNVPARVLWDNMQNFIRKLNLATGKKFRLPTEAEWEFAARGGNESKGYKYSGSDDIDEVAWYLGHNGCRNVGLKAPNELGIYDMSGNVWEWCSDWYGSYTSETQVNPTGANYGEKQVIRGGCWNEEAWECRISKRNSQYYYTYGYDKIGFRLVLPIEE